MKHHDGVGHLHTLGVSGGGRVEYTDVNDRKWLAWPTWPEQNATEHDEDMTTLEVLTLSVNRYASARS